MMDEINSIQEFKHKYKKGEIFFIPSDKYFGRYSKIEIDYYIESMNSYRCDEWYSTYGFFIYPSTELRMFKTEDECNDFMKTEDYRKLINNEDLSEYGWDSNDYLN